MLCCAIIMFLFKFFLISPQRFELILRLLYQNAEKVNNPLTKYIPIIFPKPLLYSKPALPAFT